MSIRMIDLEAEYVLLAEEVLPVITKVLKSGSYIQGKIVRDFEQDLAQYLNVKHVISCGNGTDALQISLMALGIQAGDEVIIPAFSYIAVAEVVCLLGATPVFVDVDETYFQLAIASVQKAINLKTKAIIPVHLFGQSAHFEALCELAQRNKIKIIEDCAQALGGKYSIDGKEKFLGSIGDFGCTSFFPTKNLSCFGDGGALFTNDDELAARARMIANHGQKKRYDHHLVGVNSRLDSLQAGILKVKLTKLNQVIERKSAIAERYKDRLKNLKLVELPDNCLAGQNSWHQFTIKVANGLRNPLKEHLTAKGIDSMIYYPMPITDQIAYQSYGAEFPVAQKLSYEVLSLPVHQLLTLKDIDYICAQIIAFFDARS
ncbi:DegT/DnrJ/EryC1/StrS family aminotransferase [Pedobacter arcticus]|uniref:DegT/DnrJ/EryC1/StrS family aminotransferase n=1 Tax=Pedobacter arcticus TaxID=752140 RepID=UPI000379D062|nr:DegT/DnrJ/EryC1/StrS family aminotransferase [Pedobacter arcticus]